MFIIGEECLIKRNILTSKMDLLKSTHNCEKNEKLFMGYYEHF